MEIEDYKVQIADQQEEIYEKDQLLTDLENNEPFAVEKCRLTFAILDYRKQSGCQCNSKKNVIMHCWKESNSRAMAVKFTNHKMASFEVVYFYHE